MPSFTEELRAAHLEQWNRVVHHRFTDELASNTIDRKILRHYLLQDHRFLDSFVILLASMIAHCRSLSDRIPGCQFLALITSDEHTYFERALATLSRSSTPAVSPQQNSVPPNAPCTTRFLQLLQSAAHSSSLPCMLAVLVVCEWTYLSWGERVRPHTVRDNFETYEWVDLHSGPGFQAVVAYLRGLLDGEGERMMQQPESEEELQRCKQYFRDALDCEEEFFNYFYENELEE